MKRSPGCNHRPSVHCWQGLGDLGLNSLTCPRTGVHCWQCCPLGTAGCAVKLSPCGDCIGDRMDALDRVEALAPHICTASPRMGALSPHVRERSVPTYALHPHTLRADAGTPIASLNSLACSTAEPLGLAQAGCTGWRASWPNKAEVDVSVTTPCSKTQALVVAW